MGRPRCDMGHLMKPNPTPGPGRPEHVHYWPQEIVEHPIDDDAPRAALTTDPSEGESRGE